MVWAGQEGHEMSNTNPAAIAAASSLGRSFAIDLNSQPNEARNWSPIKRGDDLPEFDYCELRNQFGTVTAEMESAYRDSFNRTFNPLA